MLAHRQISIRVGIFATIVAVVGLLAAALIAYNYRSNADIALGAADALMQQVGDKVAERTQNLVRPLVSASEFLTSLPEVGAKANFLSHPLQPLMIELLEAHPQISSIYLGFEDGEFFRVVSLRDPSVAVGLGGPETARFATWLIFHGDDGRRREAWKFLNPDRQIVGSRVGPAVSYDPRQRPWYRQAIESEHAVWTEPYAYAQPREVGLTIARRFDAAVPGVLGVDLTLASLSTFLHQQQLAEQASILMFRRDGSVLAYSNPAILVREQGEGVGSRLRLARVQELDDPSAAALYDRYQAGDGIFAGVIESGGRRYVARVEPMTTDVGAGELLGIIAPVEAFTGPIAAIGRRSALISTALAIAVLPLVWLIARAISRPLLRLAEEAEQIRHFRLAEQIDLSSHLTEVRSLATAMNSMKAGLRTFGLFVPKTLVRRMIEAGTEPALGGRRREITVLFTDVAGFTELSETMEPEALMQHLSIYLETLTRALMANGGTIDKYIGDAIMALWNAPKRDEDHAARACRAALLARVANTELDQRFRAQGLPVMQTRFGLHGGDAVVGNVGSSDRMNYTAIGASVNLAARLEGLNKRYGTRILVSETVEVRVRERFAMRTVGLVIPKGVAQPLRIFELIGAFPSEPDLPAAARASDADRARCTRWEEAYGAYVHRRWRKAADALRGLADENPDDVVARIYAERATAYVVNPPGPDWTGVETFETK